MNYDKLYPFSSEEDLQKILFNLKKWRSKGDEDEFAYFLSKMTSKENKVGFDLNYFLS